MRWVVFFALVAGPIMASAAPTTGTSEVIRRSILEGSLETVRLYRGAHSQGAFAPAQLKPVHSEQDLVQAIASRLVSTSSYVTGLTSSPQTAGSFALGVKDRDADTIRIHGCSEGYIGVTQGRAMSPSRFVDLVQRYRGSIGTLLQVMGECKVVVDAEQVTSRLSDSYPGIITSGFREMIGAALGREAEYLAFGRQPSFKHVVKVTKKDVICNGTCSASFNPALLSKINAATSVPRPSTTVRKPSMTVSKPSTRLVVPRRPVAAPAPRRGIFRWLHRH